MVEIRKLPRSRWKEYKSLRLQSLKDSPLAFGSAYGEEADLGEAEWKKRMDNVHFAMAEEKAVGMVVCSFSKEVKFKHIAEVYSFYVSPGFRGKGIGSALLDHALRLARMNPPTVKARLYVNRQQRAAVRMYEKAGFKVVGTLEKEMKVDGRFYTMLVMEKRIR